MAALRPPLGIRDNLRRGRGDSGQALVEFALVAPLFLLLLVGVFEMARAWNIYQVMTHAAREGARAAAVATPLIPPDSVVRQVLSTAIDPSQAVIAPINATVPAGTPVQVQVQYNYQFFLFSALSGSEDGGFTLSTAAVMRKE